MNRSLSIYLDLVRFAAAAAVLLAHLSFKHLGGSAIPWYLGEFGDVAVAIFFVLSGFVIAHVVANREGNWRSYTSSRFSRLYSVVLIAVAVTLVLDTIGAWANPQFYANKLVFWKAPSVTGYVSSTLLVNEWQGLGLQGAAPGSNGPWWSLSFEATYYVVAGLVLFARPALALLLSTMILAVAGAAVTALFPLWWLGFWLYRLTRHVDRSLWLGLGFFLIGGGLLLIYPYVSWRIPQLQIAFEFGRGNFQRHVLADYYSALAFSIHLLGAQLLFAGKRSAPIALERFARWVGSMTFPLYLLHMPMLAFFAAVLPIKGATWVLVTTTLVLVAVATVTPLCDRLKVRLRSIRFGSQPATI
ncbi:MAG TPA: acyltransferase [Roseateles sp.]